jgi:DNA-binding response OmpR family regulator
MASVSQNRLLVAGEDKGLREAIHRGLPAGTCEFYEANASTEIASTAVETEADLVVLQLAGYGALDVLRELRAATSVPVIALVEPTVDGVDAIDAGADDYVRLPCPPREMTAKIRSVFRRRQWSLGTTRLLRYGELEIDPVAHEARVLGRALPMPAREFDLLAFLACSPRRVFTREELLGSVWCASEEWLGTRTVTEHVRRLRARLRDASGVEWVSTVRGVGYRFDPAGTGDAGRAPGSEC